MRHGQNVCPVLSLGGSRSSNPSLYRSCGIERIKGGLFSNSCPRQGPRSTYNSTSSSYLRCASLALALSARSGFDPIQVVCYAIWNERGKTSNRHTKSYYPRFAHVKESCKACIQKQESLHIYNKHKNTSKPFLKTHFFLKGFLKI